MGSAAEEDDLGMTALYVGREKGRRHLHLGNKQDFSDD
jgi:hypothetical protein